MSENKLDWWWVKPSGAKLALVKGCEREIAVHAPGFLEEIRGMADACQSDYDLILSNMTVTYFEPPACNVVAASGTQCRNGRTVFARNHDYCDEDQQWVTCFQTNPKNCLRSVGFGFADPGRYDGVNEVGLAIGGAAIYYRHMPQPGLRMNVVTRWVLDNFSDTPSAVEYLKRILAWYDAHKGRIDLYAAKRLCSDHESGFCDHGEGRSESFGTIYSWVAEPGTGEIHVAHGRPCKNEYKVFKLKVS